MPHLQDCRRTLEEWLQPNKSSVRFEWGPWRCQQLKISAAVDEVLNYALWTDIQSAKPSFERFCKTSLNTCILISSVKGMFRQDVWQKYLKIQLGRKAPEAPENLGGGHYLQCYGNICNVGPSRRCCITVWLQFWKGLLWLRAQSKEWTMQLLLLHWNWSISFFMPIKWWKKAKQTLQLL